MPATELTAADGFVLGAYRAEPDGEPLGGLVVVQEIFGVNDHIRAVADRFAEAGYLAVAPAIFDRVEPGVELGYDEDGFQRGRALAGALDPARLMDDLNAAVKAASVGGKVGTVGYCFGGAVVWVMAAQTDGIECAVSYYGSRIPQYVDLAPRVPLMMHVGREDPSFPIDTVHDIVERHPRVVLHEYDAGHGFNCDQRSLFHAASARTALDRTLEFFRSHLA